MFIYLPSKKNTLNLNFDSKDINLILVTIYYIPFWVCFPTSLHMNISPYLTITAFFQFRLLHYAPIPQAPKNVTGEKQLYPKDPDMSWERDFPCNPIVGMGLGPSNLLESGRVWILRDKSTSTWIRLGHSRGGFLATDAWWHLSLDHLHRAQVLLGRWSDTPSGQSLGEQGEAT